jgi:basic membrane protein A and related proteins
MFKKALLLLVVLALVAAACGDDDEGGEETTTTTTQAETTTTTTEATTTTTSGETTTTQTAPPGREILACEVSDTGGIDDRSFNENAYAGLVMAEEQLEGVSIDFLESTTAADYEPNLRSMLDKGCDVVILPGFLWIDTILGFAPANPDAKFAIIDVGGLGIPNVREITFQTDEAAFLAGYAAAGTSQTGVIGTYGGIKIPSVTIFMDGLIQGVNYYNSVNGTDVSVIGWSLEDQEGQFTEDFEAVDKGLEISNALIENGADIIMPVGGKIGLGACSAISAAGGADSGLLNIGVDVDWNVSAAAECGDFTVTSVIKRIDNSVFNTVQNVLVLDSLGNPYLGTLENEGVGIAKTGAWSQVPADVQTAVEQLQADIIAAGGLADFLAALEG